MKEKKKFMRAINYRQIQDTGLLRYYALSKMSARRIYSRGRRDNVFSFRDINLKAAQFVKARREAVYRRFSDARQTRHDMLEFADGDDRGRRMLFLKTTSGLAAAIFRMRERVSDKNEFRS